MMKTKTILMLIIFFKLIFIITNANSTEEKQKHFYIKGNNLYLQNKKFPIIESDVLLDKSFSTGAMINPYSHSTGESGYQFATLGMLSKSKSGYGTCHFISSFDGGMFSESETHLIFLNWKNPSLFDMGLAPCVNIKNATIYNKEKCYINETSQTGSKCLALIAGTIKRTNKIGIIAGGDINYIDARYLIMIQEKDHLDYVFKVIKKNGDTLIKVLPILLKIAVHAN